jgi:hypothetical protein
MKQTRLLEIIREEIAGALGEITVVDKKTSSTEAAAIAKSENSDINTVKNAIIQAKKSGKPVNVAEEKRKNLAEKYQLDEETINEMASVVQTKKALSKLVDAGLSPKENLDLVIDVEKETLDQFKNSNPSMTSDGRLIRKLKPEEITGKRDTKGYGADFEQNFKKKSGVRFDEFTADIEDKFNKAFPDEKKFNSGLATNTTEKDAAAQIFNLEKGKQGRKADPNKAEKSASTGKKGIPAGGPKTEKTATLTKGDDGFDTVEDSDADNDKEATQNIGSDSTAKKLGNLATGKEETFNRILGLVEKYKDDKDKVDAFINKAKNEYKLSKTLLDQLKRVAGRDVKI